MLKMFTCKLCPLLSMAFAVVGCGKKITEPKAQPAKVIESQERTPEVIIELDTSISKTKKFTIPQNGWFTIPEKIFVLKGKSDGKNVEIVYNLDNSDSEDYEFKCTYKHSGNSSEFMINNCKDSYGESFGNVANSTFPLDKDKLITLELLNTSSSEMIISTIYSVSWK